MSRRAITIAATTPRTTRSSSTATSCWRASVFRGAVFPNSGKDGSYHIDHALHFIRAGSTSARASASASGSPTATSRRTCWPWSTSTTSPRTPRSAARPGAAHRRHPLRDGAAHLSRRLRLHARAELYLLIKGGRHEGSASTAKLMFGMGIFNNMPARGPCRWRRARTAARRSSRRLPRISMRHCWLGSATASTWKMRRPGTLLR